MIGTKFLDDFILQSSTENLKTKDLYPQEIQDLQIKVSFGMGTPAHVSWISFLGSGMSTSNGYYPVYLYYKQENILILAYGISETIKYESPWDSEILKGKKVFDLIKKSPRYGDSFVFKHYTPKINGTEVQYFSEGSEVTKILLKKDLDTIIHKYKECLDISTKDETSVLSKGLFYMEQTLENFIIENWNETAFGEKYDLIIEDGENKSQQYYTEPGIGHIDILARNKGSNNYVVIELKKAQTSDETIGQLFRYMGWVKKNLSNKNVKGIIICGKWDKRLEYARTMLKNDVEIFLYEIYFKLKEFEDS